MTLLGLANGEVKLRDVPMMEAVRQTWALKPHLKETYVEFTSNIMVQVIDVAQENGCVMNMNVMDV